MIQTLLKILGLMGDTGVTNKIAGGVNYVVLLSFGGWLYAHRLETIAFSYEQILVFGLIIFGYVELNRRAP
jgi:hypothetical protein